MKNFKIVPAAAGILALTASISFAQNNRESEGVRILRVMVGTIELTHNIYDNSKNLVSTMIDNHTRHVYLVEIQHGKNFKEVAIDANTGKIVMNREIKTMNE